MIKNHLKNLLDAGKPAIGIQLRFGVPAIAELAGLAGFDWLLIDTEHAPQTPVTVQAQLQAAPGPKKGRGCQARHPLLPCACWERCGARDLQEQAGFWSVPEVTDGEAEAR